MKLVIVESPFMFKHENPTERIIGQLRNITYTRLALHDCFMKNEAPYASHLLFTQPLILDDDNPEERKIGIDAGLDWGDKAEKSVFYTDLGVSSGMKYGFERAQKNNRPYEERTIDGWEFALDESPKQTLLRLDIYKESQISKLVQIHKTFNNFGPEILFGH